MKYATILTALSLAGLATAPAALAAPPDRPKNPPVHFITNISVNNPFSPDRLEARVAGPFAPTTAIEITSIVTSNGGEEPVTVQYRGYWPTTDPSVGPEDPQYANLYCLEGLGEGRIFAVFDEPARVTVPAKSTVDVTVPGGTQVPGQFIPVLNVINTPERDWCLVAFFADNVTPLPLGEAIVDIQVHGKVEEDAVELP